MRKIFAAVMFLAVMVLLSPQPAAASGSKLFDGSGRDSKRVRRHRGKSAAKSAAQLGVINPSVNFQRWADGHQLNVEIYHKLQPMFTQSMKFQENKYFLLQGSLIISGTIDPKNQQFAEGLVKQFNATEAFFNNVPADRTSSAKNTIVLNRPSSEWTDEEIERIARLINDFYAPNRVSFMPMAQKPDSREFALPSTAESVVVKH